MRADNALSHLHDGELCIATTRDGKRKVRWNKAERRFYTADTVVPSPFPDEEIQDWHPESIRIF